MTKLRIKRFSIQEGHYTGNKKLKKIPGTLETLTKSALLGLGIGALVKSSSDNNDSNEKTKNTVKKGFFAGLISGALLKIIINNIHNPLSTVNYDKVDRYLRLRYNIDKIIGKRDENSGSNKIENKIRFNDSNLDDYQINISVLKSSIQLYITGFTEKELSDLNALLDNYCYNYFGMEYSSSLINKRNNSYSISIIFTNHPLIAEFIVELAALFPYTINLLNNKAIIKLDKEGVDKTDEIKISFPEIKIFSRIPELSKRDLMKIISEGGIISLANNKLLSGIGYILGAIGLSLTTNFLMKFFPANKLRLKSKQLNNHFLEKSLKDLNYLDGWDYTVSSDVNENSLNFCILSGIFIACINKNNPKRRLIEKQIDSIKGIIKSEVKNQAIIWKYSIESVSEFKILLEKIMTLNIKPNIYTK